MRALAAAAALELPDSWIGAGFVRNAVWDTLHGYDRPTALNDVDVLYFDPRDPSREAERSHEQRLAQDMPGVPWSVRNQARMHLRNGDAPYRSVLDAMRYWGETPTGVAMRLGRESHLELIAAYGIDDLVNLEVWPTPSFAGKLHVYRARMRKKRWTTIWPRLTVHMTSRP